MDGYTVGANATGVGYIDKFAKSLDRYDIMRYKKELTRETRLILQAKAAQSVLKPYDYINLVFFPFINGNSAVRRAGNDAYICSELVAWIFNEAGISLIKGKPESIVAPVDYVYSEELEYIGTFIKGKRIEDNFSGRWMSEEKTELGSRLANFMGIFSKKDEFYEGLNFNRDKMNE
jgi:hypothetical protein